MTNKTCKNCGGEQGITGPICETTMHEWIDAPKPFPAYDENIHIITESERVEPKRRCTRCGQTDVYGKPRNVVLNSRQ